MTPVSLTRILGIYSRKHFVKRWHARGFFLREGEAPNLDFGDCNWEPARQWPLGALSHGRRMGRGKPAVDFSKMIPIRPMNVSAALPAAR
jgi:hypothetical protein